jgi:very-short-patch-repair endonuclease
MSSKKLGFGVRKQHPIGAYFADFYVPHARLVIEVDGEAHNRGDRPVRDERRAEYLKTKGYRLLRIPAVEVLRNLESVLQAIVVQATRPLHHQAALDGPPPRAGEDL